MDENINNEKKVKKKKLIGQIVLTSIFGLIIIGTSLAIFFARASGGLNNITTKDLVDVTYTEGSTLRLTSNTPIFEDEIESKATEFNFTINNPNSTPVYASIDLTDISMSSSLKDYDFKWGLYEGDTKLTTGSFVDAGTTLNLYNNSVINGNSSKTYKIRIWLNETGETQNFQGTSFTSKAEVTAYSRELRTLSKKILGNNNSNVLPGEYSFDSSTCDSSTRLCTFDYESGLYVQKDNSKKSEFGFPTYYYRGAVENNYVQFGTYKSDITNSVYNGSKYEEKVVAHAGDPIIWRIVRINEDGSIRLISENNINVPSKWDESNCEGDPSDGNCYGLEYIRPDGTDSLIKGIVEDWYTSNITENNLNNKVQTGSFCNDTGEVYSYNNNDNDNNYSRMFNSNPSFVCPNDAIVANEKVGLITADEMVYGGELVEYMTENNVPYLANNTTFCTLTPNSNYFDGYINFFNGATFNFSYIDPWGTNCGARPVINLKPNVLIKSGNGTKDNPYIISDANL